MRRRIKPKKKNERLKDNSDDYNVKRTKKCKICGKTISTDLKSIKFHVEKYHQDRLTI